jgi:hypothetical protein
MRHSPWSRWLLLVLLLVLFMAAGCGGTSFSVGGSDTSTTVTSDVSAGAPTTTDGQESTSASGSDAATTSSSPDGLSAAIAPQDIWAAMESLGLGSPDQLTIYDYKTFGHYAGAYVQAADQNVYLVLLNDETGGWAILATYVGLDWEAVQADLRAKSAPEDLIAWANPGEG